MSKIRLFINDRGKTIALYVDEIEAQVLAVKGWKEIESTKEAVKSFQDSLHEHPKATFLE